MLNRVAFAFSLLSCSSVGLAAEEPQWLKDARARESKSLKPALHKSKDGWFKVRAPGKLVEAIEKVEGSYSIELDIGADASVYCEVYPEGIDLANALRATLTSSLNEIEANQGKIEVRALAEADAGAHGNVPFIALTWLYRVKTSDGARVGSLKQFVMEKGDQGVYCAHNDLGYTRTFATITQSFAESLETQDSRVTPYYVEISTASMSGVKVGVAAMTLELDGEGDTRARQMTAMLMATNDGAVQAQDSTHIDWVSADGSLINSVNTEASNGELSRNLALKPEEGRWIVEGEIQGKEVKTMLPQDAQPGNWIAQARELRALLAQPDAAGRTHHMDIWLSENPDRLTRATTTIIAKKDDRHFTARGEIGSIAANLVLETSSGMPSEADVRIGPVNVKLERVHVSGGF
jgi:hypothetical protein